MSTSTANRRRRRNQHKARQHAIAEAKKQVRSAADKVNVEPDPGSLEYMMRVEAAAERRRAIRAKKLEMERRSAFAAWMSAERRKAWWVELGKDLRGFIMPMVHATWLLLLFGVIWNWTRH